MLRITLSANGSLYCCSDGVRGRGAAVKYLSHNASFHSKEKIAPSNRGIKQLVSDLLSDYLGSWAPQTDLLWESWRSFLDFPLSACIFKLS